REAEVSVGDERKDRALEPHHCAHKGVDEHQQPELAPVCAKPEQRRLRAGESRRADVRHRLAVHAVANSSPRLSARTRTASGGGGGVSRSMCAMNASRSAMPNALL